MKLDVWKVSTVVLAMGLVGVVGASTLGATEPLDGKGQPHMRAALGLTEGALKQLHHATPNKEGHRIKAIAKLNEAKAEIELGIAAGED
ncbi:MAG: hypothetical protein HY908_16450 [Myxococcales bacterium]|nr:hypothetical protein [Myxococcales bacterium]